MHNISNMNRFRQIKHIYAVCLVAGLLAAVWVGQTHAHFDENPYDADLVCSVCLVGENLNHFIVTAAFEQSGNSANFEQTNQYEYPSSLLISPYYLSRAPPLFI